MTTEEEQGGGASPAADEHLLDLVALDLMKDWLFLRLEIHPFLKLSPGTAERLPLKKLVQYHAILDKVDADRAESMAELEKRIRSGTKYGGR